MRKILLMVIIILVIALGYVTIVHGIGLGGFQILSIGQIKEESQNLKAKIEEVNTLIDVNYPNKIIELKKSSKRVDEAEKEYYEYTNLSSDQDIIDARTEKSYAIEFLWARLGTHARKEGINLKFEIISSSTGANTVNDLRFTVDGSYIAITNFIYAIENDSSLGFRIYNFKLLPYQNEILQGTFVVKNVAIKGNTSTQAVTTTDKETNTNTNANTNTTTTNEKSNTTNTTDTTNTANTNVTE